MKDLRILVLAAVLVTALYPSAGLAQSASEDPDPMELGPSLEATALLEKTLFRVDVALLRLRLGEETAAGIEGLLGRGPGTSSGSDGGQARRGPTEDLPDRVADLAIQTRDASARLLFLRDVDFGRFLDGIRDGVSAARKAGLVDRDFARFLSDGFPTWYGPLQERGVKEGDAMIYRITGDTLRTVFRTVDGTVLVDQIDVNPQARLSVTGGFLAPGSDFREGLLKGLLSAAPPATEDRRP